ncbi:arginine--tRNA ligase [Candidatus Saccharibacteria bacterium]|nr:arginine--tRNA ligase [Candidatus Saccharibacteria bacterium]
MNKELAEQIALVVKGIYGKDLDFEVDLTRPDEKFGDFATNVALKLANKIGKNPREVGDEIAAELTKKGMLAEVAGPGFINITLNDEDLINNVNSFIYLADEDEKTYVVEYSDPNPFKTLHAGHLYTTLVGDAIANIIEKSGAKVVRVNYGGDVGMHAAKSMYAIIKELGGENPKKLSDISDDKKLNWLSEQYIAGSKAYEDDETAKKEITLLNKRIYELHAKEDHESDFSKIYWTCRQWSYDGFAEFYDRLEVKSFDKYYPESSVAELGKKTVEKNIGKVYEKSDGAIVFKGEKAGLHTRVFINKEGLPTYEAKEVGVSIQKYEDYKFDKSVIITGNEIAQYMQVVLASMKMFKSDLVENTIHLTHGMVKLEGGVKMSSRKGNFLTADDILESANQANKELNEKPDFQVTLAAVKFALLKNSIGGDIIYDPKESVSMEGKSGPYLQYALVRARSILSKAQPTATTTNNLEPDERKLARKLSEYPEIFVISRDELSPHHLCNYLYELAQVFNRFYENNRVLEDVRSDIRLFLVEKYKNVLEEGLSLLGISAPEKM